ISGASARRAFLYTDAAGLRDLNTLIDPSLGWVLQAANDINDAGQIVGYGFNNVTGQTHAVRLQPIGGPPPECTVHCLRSTSITLRAGMVGKQLTISGDVTVQDEAGHPLGSALVVAIWTQADGTES